jgi:hypothetical protein
MRTVRVIAVLLIYGILSILAHLSTISATPVLLKRDPSAPVDIIPDTSGRTQLGLFWGAVGLAIIIGIFQTLVTTMVVYADEGGMWTFRFRLALFEYIWWTIVSILLCISFGVCVISYLAGELIDATSLLVIAGAAAVAIVSYTVPAWRSRHYVKDRWLAWTGPCRSAVSVQESKRCGDSKDWMELARSRRRSMEINPFDDWGWWIPPWKPVGIKYDPFTILGDTLQNSSNVHIVECVREVYDGGHGHDGVTSLLWGETNGFRKRVARSIVSIPVGLTKSRPLTTDGYNGEALCLAFGILERTKGPRPEQLKFKDEAYADLPYNSRLAQVRNYYKRTMVEHYHAIGDEFVSAAVELTLLLTNCSRSKIQRWLSRGLEQQSMKLNMKLAEQTGITKEELEACYQSSYVSMIMSLTLIRDGYETEKDRPDLYYFAIESKRRSTRTSKTRMVGSGFCHRATRQGNGILLDCSSNAWFKGLP